MTRATKTNQGPQTLIAVASQPAAPRTYYTLTAAEAGELPWRVLAILQANHSKKRTIKGRVIARALGYRDDRKIRVVIEQLIEKGYTIASSNRDPMGYFLIETMEDARIYESTLQSRALKTWKRWSNFRAAVAKKFGAGAQIPLFDFEKIIKELE